MVTSLSNGITNAVPVHQKSKRSGSRRLDSGCIGVESVVVGVKEENEFKGI